jgi:hypothetical protein
MQLGPKIEHGSISLLHDPQTFAERLFSKLRASKEVVFVSSSCR